MSTRLTFNPKTGRVERKTTQQIIRESLPNQSPAPRIKKEAVYAELTDDGISKDVMRRDSSGKLVKTGEKISEEQKKVVDTGQSFPSSSGRSRSRSRSTSTASKQQETQTRTTTKSAPRQSTVVQRTPQNIPYVTDPISRTSRPLFQTSPISKTSPQKPASEVRGTITERLPDGTSRIRAMTAEEQRKADKSSSYGGRVWSTFKSYFTDYESRVRLNEQYRADVDTTFDFRPESVGTVLGVGGLLATTIGGAKLGAGATIRTGTGLSTIPASIRTTGTALKTAQASGRLTPFLLEGAKKGGTRLALTAGGSIGGGLGVAEVSRARQRDEIQALRQLSDDVGFNIRDEFREVRKGTEQAISPVSRKQRQAFTEEAIRRGEAEGLTGEELTAYLQTASGEFEQQTKFAEPFYKGVVFDLPAGQLLVGQEAFKSQAKQRGQELGLTGQQLDAYVKGLQAERKARGYGELTSAIISTWGAEATGRSLNALTLKQFPTVVTSTSKAKGVGKVAARTFFPTGIGSGQEALITGTSEQLLRGASLETFDAGRLAREVGISAGVGGAIGGGRAGLTASRTATGQITRPAKTAGLIGDVFVYTADPFEVVGDVLESGRQIGVRKVLRRPVLKPVVEFADPSKMTGRFRVTGVPDFPSIRSPDGRVKTPDVPSPKIPDPRIPSPKIPDPRIPSPKIPDPRIPDPVIPDPRPPSPRPPSPRIPDPRIPDPRIPDPRIPDPRIPEPKIPSPRVPTLAFDWKMPPMLIPPLSLPTGSGGAGFGLGKRKTFVSELEQSQKLLGNLLGSGFTPQKISIPKKSKEDKKKKKKTNAYDVDNVFNKFFGVR